ncbi:MAG: hypothetical protein M1150_00430 [Patescibacteria group bacterium]|nr:hypothetical protein [Patescibacteria group bacterium]
MSKRDLQTLGALAMDLKRASLGLYRGSMKMAEKFEEEALSRENELNQNELAPYIKTVLQKTKSVMKSDNKDQKMEHLLTYSVILQNYVQRELDAQK